MGVNFLSEGDKIPGTGKTILDYWKWAHSAILDNTERGIFAEFLVGSALGELNSPRMMWDNADLNYNGSFIEVKSSAYIQSWKQEKPSTPVYGIAPKYNWTGIGNVYETEIRRFAHFYIFVYLTKKIVTK